jgi:hypothetical protein
VNRKKFLLLSGVVASGVAVPVLVRWMRHAGRNKPLLHPASLEHLFDEQTIRGIGVAYRSAAPSENAAQPLTSLLLNNPGGPAISADDDSAVGRVLQQKVHGDFEAGRIVMVDGWILSVTEARQCALFSIAATGPV